MNKIYVIGDLHFGHKNIIGFTTRGAFARTVDEHDELLLNNWNETIRKNDTVYVLGDVAWTRAAAFQYLPQLHGKKYLVGGNHDVWNWVKHDFEKYYGAKEIKDVVLTHIPIHPQELYTPVRRWEFNVHGHLHDNRVMALDGTVDKNYINVCCEHVGMRPVELDAVIERAKMARDGALIA